MTGLDTHGLVRYIVADNARQSSLATRVIESRSIEASGFVPLVGVVERVRVLAGANALGRERLAEAIEGLLRTKGIVVERADTVHRVEGAAFVSGRPRRFRGLRDRTFGGGRGVRRDGIVRPGGRENRRRDAAGMILSQESDEHMSESITTRPPDRLSTRLKSAHYDASLLERGIGVRFNGVEKTDVEEYCVSEGWIRVAVGKARDRHGNPTLLTLKGTVEVWFLDEATPPPRTDQST